MFNAILEGAAAGAPLGGTKARVDVAEAISTVAVAEIKKPRQNIMVDE